jgi:hypothetical protein
MPAFFARFALAVLLLILALAPQAVPAAESEEAAEEPDLKWFASIYGGQLSSEGFREWFLLPPEMETHLMAAASVGRELCAVRRDFRIEAEAIAGHHFGDFRGREVEYQEAAAALNLRWKDMPWDRTADTSLGFGLGVSLATEVPEPEVRLNGASDEVLVYMMVDATLAHPRHPWAALFFRVHHRSGGYGLLGGVKGGSNYLTGGLRFEF